MGPDFHGSLLMLPSEHISMLLAYSFRTDFLFLLSMLG
jgi:hypothetical protein